MKKAVFLDYDERNAQECNDILPLLVTYREEGREVVEAEEFWLEHSPVDAKSLEEYYTSRLRKNTAIVLKCLKSSEENSI